MKNPYAWMVGVVLLVIYGVSNLAVQTIRSDLKPKEQNGPSLSIPPVVLKAVAGEFKGLLADYTLIEAASIFGKKEKLSETEWDVVGQLFRQSMALDPYFEQSCHLIQGSLPWFAGRYDTAITLLNESKDHRYWDWVPGYFIGFDYFYFLKDNMKASEYLMMTSAIEGAPPALATFAARLAQEAGSNEIAIAFLEMVLMKENDPDKKEMLLTRLETHKILDMLERGLRAYHLSHGFYPESLQTLVTEGYIPSIPANPNGGDFVYNNKEGSIKF